MQVQPGDELTVWLNRMSAGEADATSQVASLVYEELRRLAGSAMSGERRYNSLQPTLIVNEAFLKLLKGQPVNWQDRAHFFTLAGRMMRRIVVDHFRNVSAQKRPQRAFQISMDEAIVFSDDRRDEVLIIDEALRHLSEVNARAAQVVELRYFVGLSIKEVAEALNVAPRTVRRDWEMAGWWLKQYLGGTHPDLILPPAAVEPNEVEPNRSGAAGTF
jgi:RNA polymerase sigma factor (TIGR02999 family)